MDYTSLLKPDYYPKSLELLGQNVFIRRLTAAEVLDYSVQIEQLNDNRQIALLGCNLLIAALVNPDGSQPKADELPTAEALLAAHSNADLTQAVIAVQKYSYGSLEEAEKN